MWVLTLASGQNCAMHAGNFAATTTLSLVLLGFKLKPFEAVYTLQKQLLLWAVGVVHCAPQQGDKFCHLYSVIKS